MAPSMNSLSFDELDDTAVEYDEAVQGSFLVDRFCSSSFWILPAARHLLPPSGPRIESSRTRLSQVPLSAERMRSLCSVSRCLAAA